MEITTFLKNASIVVTILVFFILLTRFFPTIFDQEVDIFLKKISIYVLLILISFYCFVMFLRARNTYNREGFQDYDPFEDWKALKEEYSLDELCQVYDDVFAKIFEVEKGAPPIQAQEDEARATDVSQEGTTQLTDEQAREKTKKYFTDISPLATFPCDLYKKVNEAKDIDNFYVEVEALPSDFLPQAYETALAIKTLVERQEQAAESSLQGATVEGFQTREPCSPEVIEERRKFLRQQKLDEAAQRCFLPEEMPLDEKKDMSRKKIDDLRLSFSEFSNQTLNEYQADIGQKVTPKMAAVSLLAKKTVKDILEETKKILEKLDSIKKKAESGELVQELNLPQEE